MVVAEAQAAIKARDIERIKAAMLELDRLASGADEGPLNVDRLRALGARYALERIVRQVRRLERRYGFNFAEVNATNLRLFVRPS